MHRSKLTQLVIDVPAERFASAVTFWSQALGARPHPQNQPGDRYFQLENPGLGVHILLQRAEWEPSYHVDIEADDVEAEVARLEGLGATRKRKVKTWWVMQAPTGHDFCVIRKQKGFGPGASNWG